MKWTSILAVIVALLGGSTNAVLAQIRLYEVVGTGTAVPGDATFLFDGFQSAFGKSVVNERDSVIFISGRRTNISAPGSVVGKWSPGSLATILQTNFEPPILPWPPSNFPNQDDDPFAMPSVGRIDTIRAGAGDTYYLKVEYKDFGVLGHGPTAWLNANGSELGFYSRSSSAVRGVAPIVGATMLNGAVGSGAVLTNLAGRITINGIVDAVITEGDQAPLQADGVTFASPSGTSMKWNPDGKIVHLGNVTGPGITSQNQVVLHVEYDGLGGLIPVAQSGDQHPVVNELADGGLFSTFPFVSSNGFTVNTRGDVAFVSSITDPDLPTGEVNSLWRVEPDGEIIFVLRAGKSMAVTGRANLAFTTLNSPLLCENGDIVFRGDWKDSPTIFRSGYFRWLREDGSLHLELGNGDPVDGVAAGINLSYFGAFLINSQGRIAAKVGLTLPGVVVAEGLIVQRAAGNFYAVVIEGQSLQLSNANVYTEVLSAQFPNSTPFSNGVDGAPVAFSKNGRLIFHINTTEIQKEYLIAVDVDPGPARPPAPDGAAAGRTESWTKPERFDDALTKEITAVEMSLTTAKDTNIPVDLSALTGLTEKELKKLRDIPKFSGGIREFVIKYLTARRNLIRAIELCVLENPQVGVWLLESYRSGRITFGTNSGTGPSSFAEIKADNSAACGREPITLKFIPTDELAIYDPDFFKLVNTLLHEGLHAFQEFPRFIGPHTALEQAQWALDRHIHELEASCAELERTQDLTRALLGQPSTMMAERIVRELTKNLSGAELTSALKRLRGRIFTVRHNAQETKRCRDQYKLALERFLATTGTATDGEKLRKQLAQLNWFIKFRETDTAFGEIGVSCGGATFNQSTNSLEGDTSVRQLDTESEVETSFDIGGGVEYAYDGAVTDDLSKFYVATKIGLNGVIYSYTDIDADGIYDASTKTEVASDPSLATGTLLAVDTKRNRLCAFNPFSGYGLAVDLSSNLPMPMGSLNLGTDPIVEILLEDGFVEASPVFQGSAMTSDLGSKISEIQADGSLGQTDDYFKGAARRLAAVFTSALVVGDNGASVSGQPGTEVFLHRMNQGGTSSVMVTLDANGNGVIPLAPVLTSMDSLQLETQERDYSLIRPAWKTEDLDLNSFALPCTSGNGMMVLEVTGFPLKSVDLESSYDLSNWLDLGNFQLGGFGHGVFSLQAETGEESRLFGRAGEPSGP